MSSTLICLMVAECQIRIMLMDAPTNGKAKRRECLILLQSSLLISSHNISFSVAPSYQQPSTMLGHIICCLGRVASRFRRVVSRVMFRERESLICPSFPFRIHDVNPTPNDAISLPFAAPAAALPIFMPMRSSEAG